MPRQAKSHLKSGRVSRLTELGTLAVKIAVGATKQAVGQAVGKAMSDAIHRQAAEKLLETLGSMKGLPMKLGQVLSYLDGVIPSEYRDIYRDTLSKLQVRVRPMDWEAIESTLTRELGRHPDEVFATFDRSPVAAASIGQVYRATLKTGERVAVKIQ
jgi:predicted unusual protein kinase regulating ubiquinone biosynthesis (AarF/ABC1/UbiB family)